MACPHCRLEDVDPHADLAECIAELRRRREALEVELRKFMEKQRDFRFAADGGRPTPPKDDDPDTGE